MKLASVTLEDFRQFRGQTLDLRDELGRPRDRILLVGPSSSGKTTVLDAIALTLGSFTELPATRADLRIRPTSIVREGAARARVVCRVEFSDEEIAAAHQIAAAIGFQGETPRTREVEVEWNYDAVSPHASGPTAVCRPAAASWLFKARVWVARLLRARRGSWKQFEQTGGVFTIDQERTSLGRYVRRELLRIIEGSDELENPSAVAFTTDTRAVLLDLAVRAKIPRSEPTRQDPFAQVQQRFAQLFAPRQLLGVFQDEFGQVDLQFSDGEHKYGFDGLSGGEGMALLLLTKMVSENIHRSIVLLEELELHMHPIWQRKLLYVLEHVGKNNQLIISTHSPYLQRAVAPQEIFELGPLDEHEDAHA